MNTTKTNLLQKIGLPEDLMSILKWHSDRLDASIGPMRESELLFPSETGEFRAASCLDRPFDVVCEKLGLKNDITARAMRRTFTISAVERKSRAWSPGRFRDTRPSR